MGRFFKADIVFSNLTYVLRSFHNILREDIDINKLKDRIIEQKTIFAEGKGNKKNEISKDLIDRIFNNLTQLFIK